MALSRYQDLHMPGNGRAQRVLFVMGMGSRSLRLLNAIPDWRRCFDVVVAFSVDFSMLPVQTFLQAEQLQRLFFVVVGRWGVALGDGEVPGVP